MYENCCAHTYMPAVAAAASASTAVLCLTEILGKSSYIYVCIGITPHITPILYLFASFFSQHFVFPQTYHCILCTFEMMAEDVCAIQTLWGKFYSLLLLRVTFPVDEITFLWWWIVKFVEWLVNISISRRVMLSD